MKGLYTEDGRPYKLPATPEDVAPEPRLFFRTRDSLMELSWHALRLYGTSAQLTAFARFRWKYIDRLLQTAMRRYRVTYDVIGTSSPTSDIDISVYSQRMTQLVAGLRGKRRTTQLKDLIAESQRVGQFISEVLRLHHCYFAASLADMFDTNLYGSIVVHPWLLMDSPPMTCICSPNYGGDSSSAQRVWAFVRIAQLGGRLGPRTRRAIGACPWFDTLLGRATELVRALEAYNVRDYAASLTKYYERVMAFASLAKDSDDAAERMYNAFSQLTMYEHDSYHTMSTLMHIVHDHGGRLPPAALFDSIIENTAFALQALCASGQETPEEYLLPRIAKYMERSTDAMLMMPTAKRDGEIAAVHELCKDINEARKKMSYAMENCHRLMTKMVVRKGQNMNPDAVGAALVRWVVKHVPYVPHVAPLFDVRQALL